MGLEAIEDTVKPLSPVRASKIRQEIVNYALKKEGVASMMENLVGVVYKNPDCEPQELLSLADEYVNIIGLDEEMVDLTNFTIAQYISRRARMKEVRKAFPCDRLLFKAVCGEAPHGDLKVDLRPLTFNFVCDDRYDYALLTASNHQGQRASVNRFKIRAANITSGMFLHRGLFSDSELLGSIIVESGEEGEGGHRASSRLHEEQHALLTFLHNSYVEFLSSKYQTSDEEYFDTPWQLQKLTNLPYFRQELLTSLTAFRKDLPAQERLLAAMLRIERKEGENDTKQEILAYLRTGGLVKGDFDGMSEIFQEEGYYDSFPGAYKQETVRECILLFKQFTGMKRENLVRRVVDKIFMSEYKSLLSDAMIAFTILRDIGFSLERTLFLLITEPLTEWKKMSERMLVAHHIQSIERQMVNQP